MQSSKDAGAERKALEGAVRLEGFTLQDGVYYRDIQEALSYPDVGNEMCFQLEEDSFWFQHRNRLIEAGVRAFPPGGPIFDVGGGNGFVSAHLQRSGFPCVLFEPGVQGAKNARKRGIPNVFCSLFDAQSIRPSSVDAVGIFDVLEHIQDDEVFLRMLHASLREGGMLYLTVPAMQSLWSEEDDMAGHFRRYSLNELEARVAGAGFEVLYATYFFWALTVPILLLRKLSGNRRRERGPDLDRAKKEHTMPAFAAGIANWMLSGEIKRVTRQKTMSLGSSLLLIAKKQPAMPCKNP